jgi:hypothetical protein
VAPAPKPVASPAPRPPVAQPAQRPPLAQPSPSPARPSSPGAGGSPQRHVGPGSAIPGYQPPRPPMPGSTPGPTPTPMPYRPSWARDDD